MNKLPRRWATFLGVVFVLGMLVTTLVPYFLAAIELGDEGQLTRLFQTVGAPLQVVAAIHVVCCLALAVLGFIAIRGRPASVGVMLAVIAAPALAGIVGGRAEMSNAATSALALAEEARPGSVAEGLNLTAWPLFAGVLASAALLFAFAWMALLSQLALHKKGVGGTVSFLSLFAGVPAIAAIAVTGWYRLHQWPQPSQYSGVVWFGAVLFALALPFALPASRGLAKWPEREQAGEALGWLLGAVWAVPVGALLLAGAHAMHELQQGLDYARQGGGVAAILRVEQQLRDGHLEVAWNFGLACLAVAPLLFFGGAARQLRSPHRWGTVTLAVLAVLGLGLAWFELGRRTLMSFAHEPEPSDARYAGLSLPRGRGSVPLGEGPGLRLTDAGELKWESAGGQLSPLEEAKLDEASKRPVRVVAPPDQPFARLVPGLQRLAQGRPVRFALVEKRLAATWSNLGIEAGDERRVRAVPAPGVPTPAPAEAPLELSALARIFEPHQSEYTALGFGWRARASLEAGAGEPAPEDPPHGALGVWLEGKTAHLVVLPQGESWALELEKPAPDALDAARGRLDESPWVVLGVGPGDKVEAVAQLADLLGERHAIELFVTGDVAGLKQAAQPSQ